jgi:hypothetical protein
MNDPRDVTARLKDLLRREQTALAEFLAVLADFDRRRQWLELGYRSLFEFLHRELGLSKTAAHFRKVAAELAQRFPAVLDALKDGRLCMTSVVELAKVITPENLEDMLPRFFHRSRREAMEIVAELRPAEQVPTRSVVTPIRTAGVGSSSVNADKPPIELVASAAPCPAVVPVQLADANSRPQPPKSRADATPLTAELSRFHVTVSRRFLAKLERARDALSHARPGATDEEILEAGLDLLLKESAKRKGLVEKPRNEPPPSRTDRFPSHVRRAVWTRDAGRCQWKLDSGEICGCTRQVEFAHVVSRARGGPPTAENTRLLCRVHNQHEARLELGDAFMDRFTRARGDMSPPAA